MAIPPQVQDGGLLEYVSKVCGFIFWKIPPYPEKQEKLAKNVFNGYFESCMYNKSFAITNSYTKPLIL